TVYAEKEGMPDVSVFSFHEDAAGDLWMATDGGIVRLREGAFTSYTTRHGLFDDTLYRILEDDRGRLWISSSKGIFRVNKRELDEISAGRAATSGLLSGGGGKKGEGGRGGFKLGGGANKKR